MSSKIETRDWIYYPDENVVRYREGVDYAYPFSGFPPDYPPLPATHEKHVYEFVFMNDELDFFTELDKRIFKNHEKPVRIELSKSIKYIDEDSFAGKTISSLVAPVGSKLSEILPSAFNGCTQLTLVDLEHTEIDSISDYCFYACINLYEIKLPKKLKHIGEDAFSRCTELKICDFPDTLKVIEEGAFNGTNNLKEINIPPSVKKIGDRCFTVVLTNARWRQTPIGVNSLLTFIRMTDNTTELGRDCFLRTVDNNNASIVLLGRLQQGNEDFPNHRSFMTCHRRAQLDLPITYPDRGGVSNWGTCLVSQNWRPKQTIPYETTLLDHNINKKLTFSIPDHRTRQGPVPGDPVAATLGYGVGLDVTGMPIDQDLKAALLNEYPELGSGFFIKLHGDSFYRDELTLRELLEGAIAGSVNLNVPIQIVRWKGEQPHLGRDFSEDSEESYSGGPKIPSPIRIPIRPPSQHPMTPARSLTERAASANIRFVNPQQSASFVHVVPPTVARIDQIPLNQRLMPQFDGLLTVDQLRQLPTQRPDFSPPRTADTVLATLLEDPNTKGGRTRRLRRRHRGTRKRRHKKRTRGKRKRRHRTKKH